MVYGPQAEGRRQANVDRVWMNLERNTRIGLQKISGAETREPDILTRYLTAVILIAFSDSRSVGRSFWPTGYLLKLRMKATSSAT